MRKPYFFIMICIFTSHMSLHAAGVNGVDIHGFLSQGYLISSDNNYFTETTEGSFQFNEMGINFSSKLTPKLHVGIQLFAYDLGDLGNDKVTLDWVFADYHWQEWLGIRVGKIKIPLGLYNEVRDVDLVRTFINLPQSVYQERYREAWVAMKGAGLYGNVESAMLGALGYQLQVGSMDAGKDSGSAKHLRTAMGYYEPAEDFDMDLAYAGKVSWQTPVIPCRLAASVLKYGFTIPMALNTAYSSPISSFDMDLDEFVSYIGSVEYIWKNLVMVCEYSEIDSDGILSGPSGITLSLKNTIQGYYGSISYRFYDWFELGTYYSVYYLNDADKDGKKNIAMFPYKKDFQIWSKDACLTARFDINSHWVCKVEGHIMNGAADLFETDNLDEAIPVVGGMPNLDIEEDWFLFGMKLSYFF